MDGPPRTVRRSRTSDTCPLPLIADQRRCMLTYVTPHPLQDVQGQLCGMAQAKTNQGIHLLHPVVKQALAPQGVLPARTADAFAVRLAAERAKVAPELPLLGRLGRSERATVPAIQRDTRKTLVARSRATRAKPSLGSMRLVTCAS